MPVWRDVHQTHYKAREEHLFRTTRSGLVGTCKKIFHDKRLMMFMLAFFFYIDGVHTIITMSTSYGTDLGIELDAAGAGAAGHAVRGVSPRQSPRAPCGRFGTKRMLLIAVFAYFLVTLFAAFFLRSAAEFWVLAICVGLFQGGIQALSRSEFGKLIPKEHANEYYGFFDIFGKYAAIMGTLLVSVFTQFTGNSSLSACSAIAVLFIVGFLFLRAMPPMLGDS